MFVSLFVCFCMMFVSLSFGYGIVMELLNFTLKSL